MRSFKSIEENPTFRLGSAETRAVERGAGVVHVERGPTLKPCGVDASLFTGWRRLFPHSLVLLALACSGNNPVVGQGSGSGNSEGGSAGGAPAPIGSAGTGAGIDFGEGGVAGAAGTPTDVEPYCGDGAVGEDEECDDGNTRPGDGCSARCIVEQFHICPEPGEPCESTITCGDRQVAGEEACDDGNLDAGDGCSADCLQVEEGFTCPTSQGVGGDCQPVVEDRCGDGRLGAGEECDDGDDDDTDGCTNECTVQDGYDCPQPGQPCTLIARCGDGRLSGSEECDDGAVDGVPVGGDGCSAQCQLEADYACPVPGESCVSLVVCGDGKILGSETCDDANEVDGDGCSAACEPEPGWDCPAAGAPCRPAACGDGIAVGLEDCDDGNSEDGDGCSAGCELEQGYVCEATGGECEPTVCGDELVEGTEQCEDLNQDTGDGCSPLCMFEPNCTDGVCEARCGDGLKLESEGCDDGNTRSGDGCSETCEIEPGYTCEVETDIPVLPIVYRDFIGTDRTNSGDPLPENEGPLHPDFEQFNGGSGDCASAGEDVELTTDADGKPVLAESNGCVDSAESFAQWYRSDDAINRTIVDTITMTPVEDMPGAFEYVNDAFFPLTGRGFNDPDALLEVGRAAQYSNSVTMDEPQNFHFTSELRYWFTYRGGERLTFYGDDDVWVFINGHLAVAIPGIHSERERWIELPGNGSEGGTDSANAPNTTQGYYLPEDLSIELDGVYDVVVYQAERHTRKSQYRLTLQNFLNGRSRCNPVCGDGVVTRFEACDLGEENNTGEYGTCTPECTLPPRCGDGTVQEDQEECDEGTNLTIYDADGEGCAPGCVRPRLCGDGVVDSLYGEECDAGEDNGADGGECTATCKLAPFCGNGVVDPLEICDDGPLNGTSSSDCSALCTPKCGDGELDPGEQCDDGVAGNDGSYGGCTPECTRAPYCGDGIPQKPQEECDDGVNDGSYGGCNADCTFAGYCGDGERQAPAEQCDSGDDNVPVSSYGEDLCIEAICELAPYCGDGETQSRHGEQCDGGPGCNDDCQSRVD